MRTPNRYKITIKLPDGDMLRFTRPVWRCYEAEQRILKIEYPEARSIKVDSK